ncbi:MAG: lamin tail domain-containing protein, partial [Sedimentisphaerales bacterium]|nr:lamin tail domain-containing protein [Sedimentisphaerales bacterium]
MNTWRRRYCFGLFFTILVLITSAFAGVCPPGDIDKDCTVDVNDLSVLVAQWLYPEICEEEPCADLVEPIGVDFFDFSVLAYNWQAKGTPLFINEFMASNNSDSGISDPNGDFDDWIEIYNSSDAAIDLAEMYLTDDLENPTKWQFPTGYPAQTTVPADGFVIIWADEEQEEGPLHTSFKLSAGGEDIALVDTDGLTVIDSISFGTQVSNLSYGRYPDAADDLRFFATPTPLADNNDAYLGIIEDAEFSHERGFYEAPFNVTIATTTNGADIYYTTDGSDPIQNELPSPSGIPYTGPVAINTTTCLRAAAIKTGYRPSPINTHTYIFIDDVAQQPSNPAGWPSDWGWANSSTEKGWYPTIPTRVPSDYQMDPVVVNSTLPGYSIRDALLDIPTVSIAMKPEEFLTDHDNDGIYSNSAYRWERKCSVEYILPDGNEGFQVDCKVEIHGNASRYFYRMHKHSMRLTFTSQYGPPKLKYELFPESPVDIFNQLILRACFTDSWGLVSWDVGRYRPNDSQYTRDVWMKESLGDMGQPSSHGNYVHLYVDGLYFGLHNLTERFADDFLADHLGGEPEDWEINKDFGTPGSRWNAMMAINPSTQAGYTQMQNYLDMENLADYMLLHFYADSEDWPHHNGNAAANPVSGDGKFRFFVWDQEIVLDKHGLGASQIDDSAGVGAIFNKMRTSPEFRLLFGDRVQKHCFNGGAISVTGSQNRYLGLANMIDKAIVAESARWGDTKRYISYGTDIQQPNPLTDVNNDLYPPATVGSGYYYFKREDSWVKERDNIINNYIPYILGSSGIIGTFRTKNLFPSIDAPVFNVNGSYKFGGYVLASDTFTITDPGSSGGTIYYTIDGNDPRVPFTGAVSASAIAYSGGFTINKSTKLKSRIKNASVWSALTEAVYALPNVGQNLRITELMFNPQDTGEPNDEDSEYIELKNVGGSSINLNLVKFDKGLDFTFGPVPLAAGEHILVVKDVNAFTTKYGGGRPVAGQYPSSLDNGGERVRLLDAIGATILDFKYKDGWRSITDGDGYSLT